MIQQGRPFLFVSKFVHNLALKRSPANQIVSLALYLSICPIYPANQIASVISSSVIGQYLEGRLDVYWSALTYFVVILYTR